MPDFSYDPGMSPLGTAPAGPPAVTPVPAASGPVATAPLAAGGSPAATGYAAMLERARRAQQALAAGASAPTTAMPAALAAPGYAGPTMTPQGGVVAPPEPEPTAPMGAVVGLARAPSSYTPERMRPESVEQVRTQGVDPLLDEATAFRRAAAQREADAMRLQQQAGAEAAGAQAAIQDAERERARALQAREAKRQAAIDTETRDYVAATRKLAEELPSEERAKQDLDDGRLAMLTVGQVFTNIGRILQGKEPVDMVGAAIQQRIANQRIAYQAAGDDVARRRTVLGDLRQRGADQREAELAIELDARQRAAAALQSQLGRITEPAQRAAAEASLLQQQQKAAAAEAELRGKVGAKVTEREKFEAARSSGGGLMVRVATPSGEVMMTPAQAAQFQGLTGTSPDDIRKNRELVAKEAEAGVGTGAAGGDPRTVIDPEGVPVRFPTQKQADEYRQKFDATASFEEAKRQLRQVDDLYKAGKLSAYEAQQRAEGIAGNVRGAIWTGVRGRTDAPNQQEADSLDRAFPTPQYGGTLGSIGAYAGDVWAGTNRRESGLRALDQLAADAKQAASRLAAQRGVKNESGRGGRGTTKFEPKARE